jgi:hypothetical protein
MNLYRIYYKEQKEGKKEYTTRSAMVAAPGIISAIEHIMSEPGAKREVLSVFTMKDDLHIITAKE